MPSSPQPSPLHRFPGMGQYKTVAVPVGDLSQEPDCFEGAQGIAQSHAHLHAGHVCLR